MFHKEQEHLRLPRWILLPTIKLAFAILTFELTSLSPQNSINLTGAKENSWVRGVTSLRTRDNRENQNLKERTDTVDSLLIPHTTDSFLCCLCVLQALESRGVGGGGLVKVTLEWGLRGTVASEETLISHFCLHFNHTEFASNLTHFTEKLSKHCHFSRGWNRKTIASHFRVGTPMDLPLDLQIYFSKWD